MAKQSKSAPKGSMEQLHAMFCEQLLADLGDPEKRGPGLYAAIIRFLDNNDIRASMETTPESRDRLGELLERAKAMQPCPDSSLAN
jgi:hypothetical protein